MDEVTLRKVQLVQLEIAKEICRVCSENKIKVFLESGSALGAVRHKGFIPWDDDLDMGMLRTDYEKFCKIAPGALKPQYILQTWHTDKDYPLPFGKVRKKGTVYLESKSARTENCGIYVDVFPFDNAPKNTSQFEMLLKQLCHLERILLIKNHFEPWKECDHINWLKMIAYTPYQIAAFFSTRKALIRKYELLVKCVPKTEQVYEQIGVMKQPRYQRSWMQEQILLPFENDVYPCPVGYDEYLTVAYGNYMTPPPEEQRQNRHLIYEVQL